MYGFVCVCVHCSIDIGIELFAVCVAKIVAINLAVVVACVVIIMAAVVSGVSDYF